MSAVYLAVECPKGDTCHSVAHLVGMNWNPSKVGNAQAPPRVALSLSLSPGLWGLVNNAGILGYLVSNQWLTKQDFVDVLNVNLLGMIEVTLSLLPLVRKARGRVVNISSVMGRVAMFGGGYSISKYGLEAFSDSLRRELLPFDVKVAMIEPGFFQTNLVDKERLACSIEEAWDHASPEVKELYGLEFLEVYQKLPEEFKPPVRQDLSLVTDCMEHALTARHPRTRYSPGWDAKFFYLPLSYMPTCLVDAMVSWLGPKPAKAL
ncbi:retinol dehydrogenase 16-like isoform X3 [Ochotona princeps]|uniref:retinol dehydrogenase 16-like isoform X3 n=1 Tax=Ochotona princeps TaxID=9978 RepID=UPI0027154950|nr:retinol dehydrogenase 16-like isoform X3 [Ochotona princeps]